MTLTVTRARHDGTDAEPTAGRRRGPRPRTVVAVVVVLTAALGTWAVGANRGDAGTADVGSVPVATADVLRETLADTRSFRGTLGYGEASTISTTAPGVITGLAAQGSAIDRGGELFRLDERPVTALLGAVPMYRDLDVGDTGADVAQLEANLADLGYTGFTVDDTYTAATAAAVRAWQRDLGLPETGIVWRHDVVFIAEAGRVDTLHVRVGATVNPGAAVFDLSGSAHVVSLDVELRDRDLLSVDAPVAVGLPGGREVTGTVSAANAVPGSDGDPDATVIAVEVVLDEPVDEALLGARADVLVDVDERADVLTVPVNALLALAGGGHAVEIVTPDGTLRLVPVETGLFASGRVEVSGEGIDEGTTVAVAGR